MHFVSMMVWRMGQELKFRVAIGTSNGRHSGMWRIWTGRNDVYIAGRTIGGEYKVSLHDNEGIGDHHRLWREAFTKDYWEELGDRNSFRDDRLIKTLLPGFEIRPGILVAFIIQTHISELREFEIDPRLLKKLTWVAPPNEPNDVGRFYVAFVDAHIDDVLGEDESQLLFDHQLPNSKRVVGVYSRFPYNGNYTRDIGVVVDMIRNKQNLDLVNEDPETRTDFSSLRYFAVTDFDGASGWLEFAHDTVWGDQKPPWKITP